MIVKDNEMSIKQYAQYHNITVQTVWYRIRLKCIKFRYLLEDTEEFLVIERDSHVQKKAGRKKIVGETTLEG